MSNITSVDLRSFSSLNIPIDVQNRVFVPIPAAEGLPGGGWFVAIMDMPLVQKIYGVIPGLVLGGLSSEGSMTISNFVVNSIIKKITFRRNETNFERRMGYALGASLWGYFVDTLGSSYFTTGMKVGSVCSALVTAMQENNEFEHAYTLDDKCYAVVTGMSLGGLVIYTMQSYDLNFVVSLAAGSLTANQVTKLYFMRVRRA